MIARAPPGGFDPRQAALHPILPATCAASMLLGCPLHAPRADGPRRSYCWPQPPRSRPAGAGNPSPSRPPLPAMSPATVERGPAAKDAHLPPGIDWFAGDVDAAFAAARAAPRPLFLYWGAEWCPPCAQVKATIFNRREFQDRSRLFVPVYLDGDTPSAQKQAERFGVVGYPTMILFRPGRHRDHAPAGRRGHRALREDSRRGTRRRATRKGHSRGRDQWART